MAPDRLWVADFTYVPTWSGMVYVEAATLEWVHWFNIEQTHGSIDDLTPIEAEAFYYSHQERQAEAA